MRRFMVRAAGAGVTVLVAAGLLAIPTTGQAAAPHRAAHARAAAVALKAPTRVDQGERLVLIGTVRNRAVGTPVVVQRMFRYVGEWKAVGRTKVGKRGAVRFVDVPRRAGDRYYRLVVPTKRSRVVSRAVPVTVWEWINLSDYHYSDRRATFQGQVESFLDGEPYSDVIAADPVVDDGFMSWDIRGGCTRVRATLAATEHGTLETAQVRLSADGRVLAEGEVEDSSGRDIAVNADIAGTESLRFDWSKADSDASAAMYLATVYCPF